MEYKTQNQSWNETGTHTCDKSKWETETGRHEKIAWVGFRKEDSPDSPGKGGIPKYQSPVNFDRM